jgi:hypothetical protein
VKILESVTEFVEEYWRDIANVCCMVMVINICCNQFNILDNQDKILELLHRQAV